MSCFFFGKSPLPSLRRLMAGQFVLYLFPALLMTFAKLLCGSWILVWGWAGIKNERRVEKKNITLQEEKGVEMTAAPGMEPTAARDESESLAVSTSHLERIEEEHWSINIWPALFLGLAMVARGEIGLLISQIGRVEAELLSEDSFLGEFIASDLNVVPDVYRFVPRTSSFVMRFEV